MIALLCIGAIAAGIGAARVGAGSRPLVATASSSRRLADSVFREGLRRETALQFAGAIAEYRAALRFDPTHLPSIAQLLDISMNVRMAVLVFLDSTAERASDPGFRDCVHHMTLNARGIAAAAPADSGHSDAARDCWSALSLRLARPPARGADALHVRYPEAVQINRRLFGRVADRGEFARILDAGRQASASREPAVRAQGLMMMRFALTVAGRHDEAHSVERQIEQDSMWRDPAGRAYLSISAFYASVPPSVTANSMAARELLRWRAINDSVHFSANVPGDLLARATMRISAGYELSERGELAEGVRQLRAGVALADSLDDADFRANARMRLGRALVKMGRLAEAERVLVEARAIEAGSHVPALQLEIEHSLLHLYESLGRDADALRAGQQFVRFASAGDRSPVGMMSKHDLGTFLRRRGDREGARRFFEQMLADIDSLNSDWEYAAEYYELTGDLDRARDYYERSVGDPRARWRAFEGLTRIALALGESEAAVNYARRHDALSEDQRGPEMSMLVPQVLLALGRRDAAAEALARARVQMRARGGLAAWADETLQLARVEYSDARWSRASALADSAATAASQAGASELVTRAAALAAAADSRVATRPTMDVRLTRALRDADRSGFPALRAEVRQRRAEALAARNSWRAALAELSEAARIVDSTAGGLLLDPQQAAFRSTQRAIYNDALALIVAHRSATDAPSLFAEWSARRKTRSYGHERARPRARGLPRPSAAAAIVDYVMLDSTIAALVLTSDPPAIVALPASADSVRRAVGELRDAMDARVGGQVDQRRAVFPAELAAWLYDQLVAPLPPSARSARALTVIPDGVLQLVPFDALVDRRQAMRYMIDDHVITMATALDETPAAGRIDPEGVVVVAPDTDPRGDPALEARAVASVMRAHRPVLLEGSAATERNVRGQLARAAILHFATHAVANDNDPNSSSLALRADAADDGRLHAFEVDRLEVRARLVVLDACETARGRLLEGEGVLSLSRSFLRAGAEATVATLWTVGPSSVPFARELYGALSAGASPAAAVHAAKLALRARGATPFLWAPYVLVRRGVDTAGAP